MRKLFWLISSILLSTLSAQAQWQVLFSANGGFYEDTFELELFSTYPQGRIFYTVNGNRPTAQSREYTEPLVLDSNLYSKSNIYTIVNCPEQEFFLPDSVQHCIVIRAAVFDENNNRISPVTTQSYFIHALGCDTHGLPVVSLCADSLDLFDYEQGILVPGVFFDSLLPNWSGNFYQSGMEWERLANIEFYETVDNTGINQLAGLRTHGGNARRGPQKGLKVYARDEYGNKRFRHRFFESIPNDSFKHLVLKPFVDMWFWAGIQNTICQRMASDINVESLATRPSVLFLNGEYWGIYTICERPDARYLEDHFGYDHEEYNVIGNWHGLNENGDNTQFLQMMYWLEDSDLSDDANYEHLCSLIDINCFIDYYCLELFIANSDWPANNMRCYQIHDGKWRWIFYDGDNGLQDMDFDVFENATSTSNVGWPNDLKSTLMFRKLLENNSFKEAFVSRLNYLMDSAFAYENTKLYFDSIAALVREEVPGQASRFNKPNNINQWESLIAIQDSFLFNRVSNMIERISHLFLDSVLVNSPYCFPNPTSGEIHFYCYSNAHNTSDIHIFDLLGREAFSMSCQLNVGDNFITLNPNLAPGIYILKMNGYAQRIVRY